MSDILTFQPGVSLADGRYLLRSSVQPGRWSVTIHGIRAKDLTAVIIKTPIAPQGKSRFQSAWTRRTFQALGELNHPSRNRILDWFEQDGRPFLVMQKVKGASLEQQLQKGPLTEAVALQLIRQVAAGLAGIHSQGLLHRDIKPKNIILRQGVGIPTLVDWGLQLAHCPANRLTPFSAPEQLQGGDIFKNRLDIYSLAATLYAAVTGQVPLHPAERQHQVPNPAPSAFAGLIPPRQLQPELSPATEQAILQGMALDPIQRPATLENWLQLFPLSHSSGSIAPGQRPNQPSARGAASRSSNPSRSATGNVNSGQMGATQPPPSQIKERPVSAGQAPATTPPAFSSTQQGTTPPPRASRSDTQAAPTTPSLPKRPSSPNPPGTNYVLGDTGASLQRPRSVSAPSHSAPSDPSDQQQVQRSKLGTVSPSHSSRTTGSLAREASSQATHPPQAMVGATQRSQTPPVAPPPFKPFKRLLAISLLTASIGLSGGLLLRVLNPGSVAGFSGLGRVQNFPEADWPGETQLDDVPEDVPQPEYGGDRWDAVGEEQQPDLILDEDVIQDEVLAAPSDWLDEAEAPSEDLTVEDYREALEQAVADDYGEVPYDDAEYGSESDSDESVEPYGGDEAAAVSDESDYYTDVEPDPSVSQDGWEADPWVEEAPGDWQEAPSITADDFPEPDLPPAYEAPIPQGSRPAPAEDDALYEDV